MALSRLAGLLLLACGIAAGEDRRPPVPENVVVSVESDHAEWVLGDNALLHFSVGVKEGTAPFDFGGDNRNAVRPTRYTVTATGPDGEPVPDPHPGFFNCFGGMGGRRNLTPEKTFVRSLSVHAYLHITEPGKYTITVSHDGGWRETPERPYPKATIELTFRDPKAGEPETLVAAWRRMEWHGGTMGERSAPHPRWDLIRHPAYLDPLKTAVAEGCVEAARGLASIETREATAALFEVAPVCPFDEQWRCNPAFEALVNRAQLVVLLHREEDGVESFDERLHRKTWVEEKDNPKLVALALEAIEIERMVPQACRVIGALGRPEDLGVLLPPFQTAITAQAAKKLERDDLPLWPDVAGNLEQQVAALVKKGGRPPAVPGNAAEAAAWAMAMATRPDERPADWADRAAVLLEHEDPATVALVAAHLPTPWPEVLHTRLILLMAHGDRRVVYAAVEAAGMSNLAATDDGAAALLAVLGASDNQFIINAADRALETRAELLLPRLRVVADRAADPALTWDSLWKLATLFPNTGGGSGGDLDEATAMKVSRAWKAFLKKHEEAIRAGKRWELPHPDVPKALVPGNMSFSLEGGGRWPER